MWSSRELLSTVYFDFVDETAAQVVSDITDSLKENMAPPSDLTLLSAAAPMTSLRPKRSSFSSLQTHVAINNESKSGSQYVIDGQTIRHRSLQIPFKDSWKADI
jgi:hypothetical protein